MQNNLRKLTLAGILIALGVVLSPFSIPVGVVKCFPIQHLINIISAVILGRYYGVGMAFITSTIRLALGMGTLMAFPGSVFGALLAGILFSFFPKIPLAFLGEIIGTGIIGAITAFPIAKYILGNDVAVFAFVIPFLISSIIGAFSGAILLYMLKKSQIIKIIKN